MAGEQFGVYQPAGGLGMDALQAQSNALLGGDYSQFQESPGYQFQLEQGLQASERGAAARGGLMGGGQMKELTRLGQGYANQDFGNWLSNLQNVTQQGASIGMGASENIMQQYGGGTPGQIGATMAGLGQAKGMQKQIPWQEAQNQQDMLAQYLGQTKQKRSQEVVGAYGPQQPTTKYFGVF